MNRKFISAVLSAALLIGALYVPAIAEDERVTLIVETEGAPLLETKNAVLMGASAYMETDEAKKAEARILSAQAEVKSDIRKRVGADVDYGRTYTSVFNGFSVEAYESDIEKIRAVDGVKNVYKSVTFEVPPEPASGGESEPGYGAAMMNAQAMYDAGFDGRGKVIAIIDAAFDTSHEFFASGVEEPTLTKSKIREFIENNEFNVDISANQVYRSEKIPFAYDYCYGDADTYNALETHGNHVAGIAAGKNGVFEGTTFSGVAPEAQLVLMKAAGNDGLMSFEVIIDALDDASKLGVCAVNMSLGATVAEYAPMDTAVENMRKSGIAVVCSAGNSDRYKETTDNPDYIYNNVPAAFSASTSVASIDPNKKWVFTGGFTLGGGERLSTPLYSKLFFEKFADKYHDYVCGDTLADFQAMGDISGKIAVVPNGTDAKSGKLLEMGVVGIIVVSEDEQIGRVITASDEIPGIMVSKTVGDRLRSAETKTIQTDRTENRTIEEDSASGMAYYTSWGTQSDLELKPEITAPGSDILSAGNDDEYVNDSGTSMASPQITGAMALMSGFVDTKWPDVTGADKVALMENLLMSSADIVFQDAEKTLPESPRRQGAGLADLSDALTLPVILKGGTGKSKLSLRDRLDDNITLKFTAENLTGEDVTYDSIKIYAFTDNYEERDGEKIITDSVPLEFEPAADNPESVTVPANGEKEITLKITLDSEQTAANKEIFTNGFWVDGYIVLSSRDGSATEASMPYTGFYGDWTSFDAMTPSYFEEGGSDENGGLMASDTVLGTNVFVPEDAPDRSEYESEDYVGLSNSIDLYYNINIRMLRSLRDATTTVKNSNGDIIITEPAYMGLSRKEDYMDIVPIGVGDLPDGDYTAMVSGTLAYESERSRTEEKTYKFYVDSIPPKIKNPRIYEEDGKTYASFEASDNRYLMGAAACDATGQTVTEAVKAEKEAEIKIDVTGMDMESLEFSVSDYAFNENVFTIGTVSAKITDSVIDGGNAAFVASVTNMSADADADIIMALYDGDGKLIGVNMQNAFLESGDKRMFTFDFTDVSEMADARLFVWEHGKMTPLGAVGTATENKNPSGDIG